jgi:dihydrofolate synthase/folylpolyglutamate synthase
MMTYQQTLDWLFAQLPMYQRTGGANYKIDLEKTHLLMDLLGNPENGFKSIHVAGTNGKGSVSHLLASVLQESGLKVGLYTSPHLIDFRERIKINGVMIPEAAVISFVDEHKENFTRLQLSFFEMTVGLAFNYFEKEQVDIAVVEVGMGGRLDSTNVIKPLVSVITNIGFDHMAFLGDTLPKIAGEKAGIIKKIYRY